MTKFSRIFQKIKLLKDENKIINSINWKLSERVVVQLVNLVVQITLARILLPSDFGLLAIITAITNYLSIFVQTGISTAIIQKKELDSLDISTLSWSCLIIALFFYLLLFLLAPSILKIFDIINLLYAFRLFGIVLIFTAFHSIFEALYMRDMRFQSLFCFSLISASFSGLVAIIMAKKGMGIWSLVVHVLLNSLLFDLIVIIRGDYKIHFRFSFFRLCEIYRFSGYLMLSGVVSGAHDLLRTSFIGKYYSTDDLAYYDKAMTYSGYISNISNNVNASVLLPVLSRIQDESEKLLMLARKTYRAVAFFMFPILIGIASISESLISVFLTTSWQPAAVYLSIFCVLRIVGCLSTIDKQVYFALGNSCVNLKYEMALLVANLLTLIVLIRKGPLIIAIGATSIEFIFYFVICLISRRLYKYALLDRFKDIVKPLISSLGMCFFVILIQNLIKNRIDEVLVLLISITTGIFSYIFFELLLKDETCKTILSFIR